MLFCILSVIIFNLSITLLIVKGNKIALKKRLLYISLVVIYSFIHSKILKKHISTKDEFVALMSLSFSIIIGYYFILILRRVFTALVSTVGLHNAVLKLPKVVIACFISFLITLSQIVIVFKFVK